MAIRCDQTSGANFKKRMSEIYSSFLEITNVILAARTMIIKSKLCSFRLVNRRIWADPWPYLVIGIKGSILFEFCRADISAPPL